jgi:hypothetical protein
MCIIHVMNLFQNGLLLHYDNSVLGLYGTSETAVVNFLKDNNKLVDWDKNILFCGKSFFIYFYKSLTYRLCDSHGVYCSFCKYCDLLPSD